MVGFTLGGHLLVHSMLHETEYRCCMQPILYGFAAFAVFLPLEAGVGDGLTELSPCPFHSLYRPVFPWSADPLFVPNVGGCLCALESGLSGWSVWELS